ncbi:hypothetical protein Tco_0163398 [Tanacetum coccineum]
MKSEEDFLYKVQLLLNDPHLLEEVQVPLVNFIKSYVVTKINKGISQHKDYGVTIGELGSQRNMMGEVDIETLTIEQYLMLTQGNQAPGMVKPKFGMKEKDIEDMTIAEYIEYEAKMKRQSWSNVQPYFPTNHEDTDISSFHHNKGKGLDYPRHSYDSKTNVYYDLPPLLPCFKPVQLPIKCIHELLEEDTDYISEDESEIGDQKLINHTGGDKPSTPKPRPEDEELSSGGDLDDWLKTEMERRMCGHDKEGEEDALIAILKLLVVEYTVDSSDDMQEPEDEHKEVENLEKITSRWHVCKPVRVYDAIYGKGENGMLEQWMCFRDHERQSVNGNRMIFTDFHKVRYGNKTIDDTTHERRYYEWVAQNSEFKDNDGSYEATMGMPWMMCGKNAKFHKGTSYSWHGEGFKEEERWESGRIRAFEEETRDLDVETKQMKELKANYSVTYHRSYAVTKINEGMSQHKDYSVTIANVLRLRGDGVTSIKRHRRDLYGDGVRNLTTVSGRGGLKEDPESVATTS